MGCQCSAIGIVLINGFLVVRRRFWRSSLWSGDLFCPRLQRRSGACATGLRSLLPLAVFCDSLPFLRMWRYSSSRATRVPHASVQDRMRGGRSGGDWRTEKKMNTSSTALISNTRFDVIHTVRLLATSSRFYCIDQFNNSKNIIETRQTIYVEQPIIVWFYYNIQHSNNAT
jgi:hypothetical protein